MTYIPAQDAYLSWQHAVYMMALQIGSKRFHALSEMYWLESKGLIP